MTYSQCRTELTDVKTDLSYYESKAEPISPGVITMHSERLTRLAGHWIQVRNIAIASTVAAVICFGLSLKKRNENVG